VLNKYITYVNSVGLGLSLDSSIVIWIPDYDADSFTLTMVLTDLQTKGYLAQFQNFLQTFFGANGLVSKGIPTTLPSGLDDIIAYIAENVDREVRDRCLSCNASITNVTNSTNGTVIPPPPIG